MSDERKYTERDLTLARREAWAECVRLLRGNLSAASAREAAAQRYPLPQLLRVVTAGVLAFRVEDGCVQWCSADIAYKADKAAWYALEWGASWVHAAAILRAIATVLESPYLNDDEPDGEGAL